jgi:hypothetical protein
MAAERIAPTAAPSAEHARLADEVTPAEWALEKVRAQNPRVRAFLGCIRLLDDTLETDYHLLHCAPRRLLQIWEQIRELARVVRTRLARALEEPSRIPELEGVRKDAQIALTLLDHTLLAEIDGFPEDPPAELILDLRKLLCSAMGQLQIFLYETFGRLVAADPRSSHDADYYVSRRFPFDIEESTWLWEMLGDLEGHLEAVEEDRRRLLESVAAQLQHEQRLPSRETWNEVMVFLASVYNDLTGRLKEILCLHGIRFEEVASLKRYSLDIPTKCLAVLEIHELASAIVLAFERGDRGEEDAVRQECVVVLTQRLGRLLGDLDRALRDLVTFVPLWRSNLKRRRSLELSPARRSGSSGDADDHCLGVLASSS